MGWVNTEEPTITIEDVYTSILGFVKEVTYYPQETDYISGNGAYINSGFDQSGYETSAEYQSTLQPITCEVPVGRITVMGASLILPQLAATEAMAAISVVSNVVDLTQAIICSANDIDTLIALGEQIENNPDNLSEEDLNELKAAYWLTVIDLGANVFSGVMSSVSLYNAYQNWAYSSPDINTNTGVTDAPNSKPDTLSDGGVASATGEPAFVQSKGDSRKLRKNMLSETLPDGSPNAYYRAEPDYSYDAHHLVAQGSNYESAKKAREMLTDYKIDINNAANGVPLPNTIDSSLEAVYHKSIHSHKYYDYIYDEIKALKSADEIKDRLFEIGNRLLKGETPWKY